MKDSLSIHYGSGDSTDIALASKNPVNPPTNWCWKCDNYQENVYADYGMCHSCRYYYFQAEIEIENLLRGLNNT